MNKKYFVLTLLLMLLVLPMVFAEQQSLPNQKQGTCVQIIQSHPNATSINITKIAIPGLGYNYSIIPMSTDNGINYYYNFCDTSNLGTYIVTTCGDGDGFFDCVDYDFEVTPTGIVQNSILENPILLILLVVSTIFLILALYTKSYPMGFIAGIMFLLSGVYTMIYGFNNYTDDFTRATGLVIIGLGTIFILASGYEWIVDSNDNHGAYIAKGEDDEE